MTGTDILTHAVHQREDYPDDGSLTTPGLNALSEAIRSLRGLRHDWALRFDGAFALELGVQTYDLPADCAGVHCVRHTSGTGEVLRVGTIEDLERHARLGNSRPHSYVVTQGDGDGARQIQFYPVPDSGYTLRLFYWGTGTAATEAGEADVPVEYHRLLHLPLVARWEQYRREPVRIQQDAVRHWEAVHQVISAHSLRRPDTPAQVASVPVSPRTTNPNWLTLQHVWGLDGSELPPIV